LLKDFQLCFSVGVYAVSGGIILPRQQLINTVTRGGRHVLHKCKCKHNDAHKHAQNNGSWEGAQRHVVSRTHLQWGAKTLGAFGKTK